MAVRLAARLLPFKPAGLGDILQGLRRFAAAMDWISVALAEAARRLLRTEGATLLVPTGYHQRAIELSLAISDGIPKLIREPNVIIHEEDSIIVSGQCQLGGEAPNSEICWITSDNVELDSLWSNWIIHIQDLMVAGYPACVGCGGPGSEGVWDETASRARMRVN